MNKRLRSALVLGASGFLGQSVAGQLVAEGWRVRVLVHKRAAEGLPSSVEVVRGGLGTVKPGAGELVFHCARMRANGRVGRLISACRGYLANQRIVRRLGEARLVYASGSLMYGDCEDAPVFEDAPLRPTSYAREYAIAERPFLHAGVIMFRPGWILGPGSWFEWFYFGPAERHGKVPLYGSGMNLMSIIHREDCAAAMIHVGQHRETGVYHPPALAVVTQREFVEQLAAELQLPIMEVPLKGKERAIKEAFECSIHLQSRHTELWQKFRTRFNDLRTALRDVIAASKAHTHQTASRA